MAWEIKFRRGIHLPQIGWWLDSQVRTDRAFVSHAHSDHIARHREILCTAATARLVRARLPGRREETILPFGRAHELAPGVTATLHSAGHILGSSQILLDHAEHGTLLYTGDFKLRPGLAAEPCATPHADTLIMETTFGRPRYVFPPEEEVIAGLIAFCHAALAEGATPVLLCYSLGKTQEVLRALGPAGLPVMLHAEAARLTNVCEQCGTTFPPWREFDASECGGHVVIGPPQGRNGAFLNKIPGARTAAITGWALDPGATYRYQCHAAFPLSDHADYPGLLRFVELVQPRRVLTLHGFAAEFATTLRARGIEAWALGEANQLEMPLR
ncbi:MAG: MBL fold metallo-hydrolase [Verrucomicrobiota bacterium]